MTNKYKIVVTKQVEKFIRKLDKVTQARVIKSIYKLPEGDVKKLKGYADFFRLRVGDIRIIFEKNDNEHKIIIFDSESRGQIFKRY